MIRATNQTGFNIEFLNGAAGWQFAAGPYSDKPAAELAMQGICVPGEFRVYAALDCHFCAATGAENEPTTEKENT